MSVDIEATVSERGQVVIPKAIRDAHDIRPGTTVTFSVEEGRLVLRTAEGVLDEFVNALPKQPEPDAVDWDERYYDQME